MRATGADGLPVARGDAHLLRNGEFVRAERLADGVAEFEVPAGRYSLIVSSAKHAFARRDLHVDAGTTTTNVEMPMGVVCTFVSDRDVRSRSPAFLVSWRSADAGPIGSDGARLREDGRLEIQRVLAPGRYTVEVSGTPYEGRLEFVVPPDPGETTFVVPMTESARGQEGGRGR